MENPIKIKMDDLMDDLGIPLFLETTIGIFQQLDLQSCCRSFQPPNVAMFDPIWQMRA